MKITYLQSSLPDDLYEVADIPDGVKYRLEMKDGNFVDNRCIYWNKEGVIYWKDSLFDRPDSSTTWIAETGHLYWARPI